jgi:hypothetical protein
MTGLVDSGGPLSRDLTQSIVWWESLRLFAGLVSDKVSHPNAIQVVVASIRSQGESGRMLAGVMAADGIGTEDSFMDWIVRDLLSSLRLGWSKWTTACATAWGGSPEQRRRELMIAKLGDSFVSCNWLQWVRCREWFKVARLGAVPLRPSDGSLTSLVLDVLEGRLHTPRHIGIGRIFSVASAFWPGQPWELALLNIWPSHRRRGGRILQAIATISDPGRVFRAARGILGRVPDIDEVLSRAREGFWRLPGRVIDVELRRELALEMALGERPGMPITNFSYGNTSSWDTRHIELQNNITAEGVAKGGAGVLGVADDDSSPEFSNWDNAGTDGKLTRVHLAHLEDPPNPAFELLGLACRNSLRPELSVDGLLEAIRTFSGDPIWPALARYMARVASSADRELLVASAKEPELQTPPLCWGLKYIVRGDIVLADGAELTLNKLCEVLDLPFLPYIDELPDEIE